MRIIAHQISVQFTEAERQVLNKVADSIENFCSIGDCETCPFETVCSAYLPHNFIRGLLKTETQPNAE